MKRFIYLFIAPLMLFNACSKEEFIENNQSNGSQVEVTEYVWEFGEKPARGEMYERFTYDTNGNLIESETNYFNSMVDDRVLRSTKFEYDNENNLVEKNEYFMAVLLDYKYKYTTNSIGSIATMDKYNDEGLLYESWAYTYDSQERLLKAKQTYDLIIAYEDDYSYDGNDITVIRHNCESGELFGTTKYEYDTQNNLTKKTWINGETGEEDVEKLNEYQYNEMGQMIKMTSHGYYSKDDLTYKDYKYNSDGTVSNIHVTYSFKTNVSDLDYSYKKL